MWNGTAATLKPSPTIKNPAASTINPLSCEGAEARKPKTPLTPVAPPLWYRLVVPLAPNASAMPSKKNADEKAPSRKYFIEASCPTRDRLRNPTRT